MHTWRLLLIGFGNIGRGTALRLSEVVSDLAELGSRALVVGVVGAVVSSIERYGAGWSAWVAPKSLPVSDPLEAITEPTNNFIFETEALGTVCVAGPGVGCRSTGHATGAGLLAIYRTAVVGGTDSLDLRTGQ